MTIIVRCSTIDAIVNVVMSNKLANIIKGAVSKNKRRYQDGDYDLDLTYIKPNLIAMGFPAEKLEGVYRNHIDHVVKFLDERHKNHYKIYNLCSERSYDKAKFHGPVAHYPFDDHNPPKIELIQPFCEDVDSWLAKNDLNVAVIHCKAGKGRTGVMICAYLLHCVSRLVHAMPLSFMMKPEQVIISQVISNVDNRHKQGVTIPSQRRYVVYYDQLLRSKEKYTKKSLFLRGIKFHTIPNFFNLTPQIVIWQTSSSVDCSITKIFESSPIEIVAGNYKDELCLEFHEKIPVCGDTLIAFVNKPKVMRKERMFQFWFNTFFVREEGRQVCNGSSRSGLYCPMSDNPRNEPMKLKRWPSLTPPEPNERRVRAAQSFRFVEADSLVLRLKKNELDKANKDRSHKIFPDNFEVICYFEKETALANSSNVGASSKTIGVTESDLHLTDLDENLSDSDTDNEWNDNKLVSTV